MVRSTISSLCMTFIKTISWKSLTENTVKGHIYLDKLVTGSIYVIKYIFSRKSRKFGFLSSWVHLRACPHGPNTMPNRSQSDPRIIPKLSQAHRPLVEVFKDLPQGSPFKGPHRKTDRATFIYKIS